MLYKMTILKKIILLIIFFSLQISCSGQEQFEYASQPLKLDFYDFKTDLKQFYPTKNIKAKKDKTSLVDTYEFTIMHNEEEKSLLTQMQFLYPTDEKNYKIVDGIEQWNTQTVWDTEVSGNPNWKMYTTINSFTGANVAQMGELKFPMINIISDLDDNPVLINAYKSHIEDKSEIEKFKKFLYKELGNSIKKQSSNIYVKQVETWENDKATFKLYIENSPAEKDNSDNELYPEGTQRTEIRKPQNETYKIFFYIIKKEYKTQLIGKVRDYFFEYCE